MAIDNTVNLSQVANQYQKNDILTKPQKYQVNPNAVDKTPDKDTVQLSSGLTTKEKVGIAAVATTIVAVALAILGRNGHLGESIQKFLGGKAKKAAQEMGEHTHTTNTHVEPKPTVKPEPEQIVKPEPEQTVKPEPEQIVKPEPEQTVKPEPEQIVKPEPEQAVKPEPEQIVKPEPEQTVKPEPEQIVKPEPEQTVKPEQKVETKELPSELENIKQKASTIEEMDFNIDGQNTKFEVWKGTQKGSNKGSFVRNLDTGEVFYAKLGGKQSENEILASKLYQLGGIDVPELTSFKLPNGETGLLSKYIPDLNKVYSSNPLVNKGFAMDAFLANWDAVCSGNTLTKGNKAIRIDIGGALDFRARGGKKDFGPVVDEITTLINPHINPEAANIYSTMTREDLIASLQRVADINPVELSHTAPKFSETLIERQNFLKDVLKEVESTPQEDKSMFEYLSAVKKNVVNKRDAARHTNAQIGTTQAKQETKLVNKVETKAEQEAKAKAEQKAKLKAEQEAKAKAEQEAKAKAEREARRKAELEAEVKARRLGFNYADENMEELDKLFLDKNGNLVGVSDSGKEKCDFKDLVKPFDEELGVLYHGTTPEAKEKILTEGFRQDVPIAHGDLDGLGGTYFTLDMKNGQDYGSVVMAKFNGKVAHVNTEMVEYILKPDLLQKIQRAKIATGASYEEKLNIRRAIVLRYLQNKLKQMGYQGLINDYSCAAACQYFSALEPSLIHIIK